MESLLLFFNFNGGFLDGKWGLGFWDDVERKRSGESTKHQEKIGCTVEITNREKIMGFVAD